MNPSYWIDRRLQQCVGLVFLCHFATLPLCHSAFAQVPHLIRYQGQAVDEHDVPLEGPYTMTFRLYDAPTGGTKLWEEMQPNVVLTQGHFSVLLGSVSALAAMDWEHPCWLSVQVNGEPELSPRQQITSVPIAIRAEAAERLTVPVTTSTIADDANGLVPTGAIMLWTDTSCPAGYSRLTALDGKFLVGGSTYTAGAGGSNTHSHGAGSYGLPSHTHAVSDVSRGIGWNAGNNPNNPVSSTVAVVASDFQGITAESGGATSVIGSSASADSRPEFATIVLCQKQ